MNCAAEVALVVARRAALLELSVLGHGEGVALSRISAVEAATKPADALRAAAMGVVAGVRVAVARPRSQDVLLEIASARVGRRREPGEWLRQYWADE